MVLKRLIFTALGALGLSALVSGPASSQNIPPPKLYDDITACGGGMLPTASTAMGTAALFGSMGLVETALREDRATDDGEIDATQADPLNDLLILTACDNPVANGYTKAVELYDDYVRTKNALGDEPTAEQRKAAADAAAARDAYRGTVYDKVYDQRAKLAGVTKAISDYNELVGTGGAYALLKTGYDGIVTNNFGTGTNTPGETGDDPSWNLAYGMGAVRGYRAIAGNDTADDDEISGDEFTDAFNSAGTLQFADTTAADGLASANITTLGNINAEYMKWKTYAEEQQETLDEARKNNHGNIGPLEENVRRANAARDHVRSELTRLTSLVRSQNRDLASPIDPPGTANDVENERALLTRFDRVSGSVDSAANTVRSTVKALDDANRALMSSLSNADSYLSQLVSLRTYEKGVADQNLADAGTGAAQRFKDAVDEAQKALTAAEKLQTTHMNLAGDPDSPGSQLLNALLETSAAKEDDGLALVNAVTDTHQAALDAKARADEVAEMVGDDSDVAANTESITTLDGRVTENENDIAKINGDLYGDTESQHDDATACQAGAGGLLNTANCADARSRHNEATLEDHEMKLMQKKEYIDNLAAEIGVDPVTGEGTMDGYSRIDHNEMRSMANSGMIETNAGNIMMNAGNIKTNADNIAAETMARMDADMMLAGGIDANKAAIGTNASAISALDGRVGANASAITRNSNMIGELSESLEVVRAGVAASMALAGMPAVNGRGIAIGVGSFDGESAFAVGFQIQGEQASFKVGVTSGGGATGASAGVGFNF